MNKRNIALILAGIAFVISLIFDKQIVLFVTSFRLEFFTAFFKVLTYFGSFIFVLFFISSLFLWHKKKRQLIVPYWLGLFLAALTTYLLKLLIARPRPDVALGVVALVTSSTLYSFPSGHSAAAFSALPVMDKEYSKLKVLWIIIAFLIAFSRLYLGMHYLSDIIFGAVLGYGCAWLMLSLKNNKYFKKINIFYKKR